MELLPVGWFYRANGNARELGVGSRRMRFVVSFALAGIVGLGAVGSALADDTVQKPSCTCQTAYDGGNPVGSIRHVKGDVTVSRTTGFLPAKAGDPLDLGSRVMASANASAFVRVGGCSIEVPAGSNLDVSSDGQNICLSVGGEKQAAAGSFNLPAALLGGGLIAGGIIAATHDSGSSVSQ